MPLLVARGLVKRFGNIIAVNGLDLTVGEGEVLGLVGPNGAGKTTTIRLCLGILRRDHGEVSLFGRDPFYDASARENVGVIFEKPSFPEALSVEKLLEYAAKIHGISLDRVNEVLRIVGLVEKKNASVRSLSAGQKQRLAIAHALIHEPQLLIADEPTSNLDPLGRSEVLGLLAELSRDHGISILVSSHILPELSRIVNRLALIHFGRLVFQGTPADIMGALKVGVVRIRADNLEDVARRLREYFGEVEIRGAEIIVHTDKPGFVYKVIGELIDKYNLRIYSVESLEASIEEFLRRFLQQYQWSRTR